MSRTPEFYSDNSVLGALAPPPSPITPIEMAQEWEDVNRDVPMAPRTHSQHSNNRGWNVANENIQREQQSNVFLQQQQNQPQYGTCQICYQEKPLEQLTCGHYLCIDCLNGVCRMNGNRNARCPFCRVGIQMECDVYPLWRGRGKKVKRKNNKRSTRKINNTDKIYRTRKHHKTITRQRTSDLTRDRTRDRTRNRTRQHTKKKYTIMSSHKKRKRSRKKRKTRKIRK